jgi:FkbM family methyltransferase
MFVSYAQNLEDVMLHRALHDVEQGFYIDAGAWHPELDSVTMAFYERGWHGINIEPSAHYFDLLQQARTRDINLKVALAAAIGSASFTEFPDTGLSTLDTEIAERHADAGFGSTQTEVSTTTLREVVRQHIPSSQPVHFLKIDVEGYEAQVLEGNDWDSFRPWIIVIEATEPLKVKPSFKEWEPILKSANYIFAYQDGLNRFYVADEHKRLLDRFSSPPNVFDGYITAREVKERDDAAALRALLPDFKKKTDNHKRAMQRQTRKYNQAIEKIESLTGQLEDIVNQKQDLEKTRKQYAIRQKVLEIQLQQAKAENNKRTRDIHKLTRDIHKLTRDNHKQASSILELRSLNEQHEMRIAQIESSLSWRLTRPVRWLEHRHARLFAGNIPASLPDGKQPDGNQLDGNQPDGKRPELHSDGTRDPLADHFLEQLLKANEKG